MRLIKKKVDFVGVDLGIDLVVPNPQLFLIRGFGLDSFQLLYHFRASIVIYYNIILTGLFHISLGANKTH